MTGKGREIADLMEKRRMDILCLQETRWKGNKAKELAGGHKLLYSGNNAGRNGVAVILLVNIRENLIGVERRSDRVMSIKLRLDDTTLNVISAYAPQVGCLDEEKDWFWDEVDQVLYFETTGGESDTSGRPKWTCRAVQGGYQGMTWRMGHWRKEQ